MTPRVLPTAAGMPVAGMRSATPDRPGVALLLSLVAVILLALLAVGAMHIGRGDFLRARDEATLRRASNAADAGAYDVLRRWPTTRLAGAGIGVLLGPDTMQLTGATAVARTIRTSATTYWTVSEGSAGDSASRTLARQVVQAAFRLAIPDVEHSAALTVRDSVTLAGGAQVVGTDTTLAAWGTACAAPAHVAGVALPDTTRLCDGPCGVGSASGRVTGLPPLLVDSSAGDSTRYAVFGAEHWASLTRHAAIVLPAGSVVTPAPSVLAAGCNITAPDNWGDPGGTGWCASHAPLIWARGDVEIRGGVGQGVLLVEGDLTLSGGAQFAGVVIVRDDLVSSGVGGAILGAALAGDRRVAAGDHSTLDGATRVQRSSCAIERALQLSARLVPVRHRAWAAFR